MRKARWRRVAERGEPSSKNAARGREQQRGKRLFDLDMYSKKTQEGAENTCRIRERLKAGKK